MRKLLASHPDYQEFNDLWQANAIIKNPQLFFNQNDLGEVETRALKAEIGNRMEALLRDSSDQIANWIDGLKIRGLE